MASDSLSQTLSAKQGLLQTYDAVMIIGGNGAMFDLPVHKDTQQFIKRFIKEKHPIAAVCHGPAALVNIKLDNGLHYVANKRINSFTRVEDQAFKKEHIEHYPFILQTELEKKGANFVSNSPMLPFVTVDDNLITAQNPMSVAKATEALIIQLGKTPKQRELYKDEATFELAAKAKYQGPILIDIALKQNKQHYDLTYLALYGVYAYNLAETQENKRVQLEIMAYIGKHFYHPQYHYALMKAYEEQGLNDKAKHQKQRLTTDYPNFTIPDA